MHLYIAAIMDVETIKGTDGVDDLVASKLGGNTVASQIEGNTAAAQLRSETSVEQIINKPAALSVEYGKLWFMLPRVQRNSECGQHYGNRLL